MAHLVLEPADGERSEVPVTSDETTLGRSSDNQIVVSDPAASSRHCVILREGNSFTVRDLASTNGTFVNGQPVDETGLEAGDVLNIGAMRITLMGNDVAALSDAREDAAEATGAQPGANETGQPSDFGPKRNGHGVWIALGILIGAGLAVLLWLFIDGLFLR